MNENKIVIEIKDGSNLSLENIHKLKEESVSVLRSAHVGNLDAQTLFLAKEGFKIILDEYAKGSMRVYRPAYKIQSGKEKLLSYSDDLPVSHLYSNDIPNNHCVAYYHYDSLVQLFPKTIKLTSSHLLEHRDLVFKSLQILAEMRPKSFARIIDENGKIFKYKKSINGKTYFSNEFGNYKTINTSQLPQIFISGLIYTEKLLNGLRAKYTPIVTLDVDTDVSLITLCDVDWEHQRYLNGNMKVIHFSGLEMINYMINIKESAIEHLVAMNEIFNLLINIWTDKRPNKLEFLIVPTDALRYFICANENYKHVLNNSFIKNEMILDLLKERNIKWKEHSEETKKYVTSLSDMEIKDLIKKIEPLTNSPKAFVKKVCEVKKLINNCNVIDREDLNKILFDYYLYKNLNKTGIKEIELSIVNNKNEIQVANKVPLYSFTQYDLLINSRMFFPEYARAKSMNELKKYYRRLNKIEKRN